MPSRPARWWARAVIVPLLAGLAPIDGGAVDWTLAQLQMENDLLFPSASGDRFYTAGFRAVWLRDPDAPRPQWIAPLDRRLCSADPCVPRRVLVGAAISQQVFTPTDITIAEPQPDDRPWAGYLFGSLILQYHSAVDQHVLSAQLGVTGEPSGAELTQNALHELFRSDEPRGWDQQLPFEPQVNLNYLGSWRISLAGDGPGIQADLVPHVGAGLGTVMTYLNAGATVRFGRRIRGFPYGTVEISTITGPFEEPGQGSSFYFFTGFDARAVGRNLFLDGTLFRSSPSVEKRHFVYDLIAGFSYSFDGGLQITVSGIRRSEEFRAPGDVSGRHGFFSISVSFPIP